MSDRLVRNYTLIIDRSGSMGTYEGSLTRWDIAKECAIAVANKAAQFDPSGITIYLFSSPGKFRRFDNQDAAKVGQIFMEFDPMGTTDLAGVLKDATDKYFEQKAKGETLAETILVLTDGEADDRKAVMKTVIEASRKLESDNELAISLIQIGTDATATRFLKALDNDLQGAGAKFDVVDTVTVDDMENMSLTEVLLAAIDD